MRPPSTDWAETITDDEPARHEAFTERILALQSRINAKRGPGRAFHRKQVAALSGTLTVAADLPDHAAHGLFAAPGEFEVLARMSNGSVTPQRDQIPDIRGFAFSVRGLDAPGALGGSTDRQDFLLINRPAFGFQDSRDFAEVFQVAPKGQKAMLDHQINKHGVARGTLEMARQAADLARPFSGYATSDFHACAPIAWGPYAAHVHVTPVNASRDLLAWRDWGADVRGRVAKGALRWTVQAQFYTDPESTPIEDGRRAWDAPKMTVGVLELSQLEDSESVERDHFDPWMALADHRPLGEIMRARKAAYYASFKNRT
jgi:hypothetical protein